MRFGLIGCGWIVERDHVPAMLQSDKVEIVATADVSADRSRLVGKIAGVEPDACYADYRELLARDDIDIVSVASPPSTRLQIVCDAAAAGKHVVCEKPFALTLAEADEMIRACDAAGVTLAMYHNYLYYAEHRLAQKLIAEGAIGDVVAVQITAGGSRPWLGTESFRSGWRFEPAFSGGGVMMDIGVHAIYLAELFLPGPMESVAASMRFMDTGADDHAYCQMRAANNSTALINMTWGEGTAKFEISGTAGYIAYVYDENMGYFGGPVRSVRVGSATGSTTTHHIPPGRTQFTAEIFNDLVDTITGERNVYPAFGRQGRRTLEVAQAAYLSTDVNRFVDLPISNDSELYTEGTVDLLLTHRKEA
jgi:predicted dehydrogenase